MRHQPHRQGALVTALLAALLAGGAGLAPAAAAAPKDRDTGTAKAKHGHAPSAPPRERAVAPATQHKQKQKQQRRVAAVLRPSAVAPPVPPAAAPTVITSGSRAVLRPEPPTGSPFRRTTRPFRPLVRPSAVPRSTLLWRVHEPVERPLLRALRTTAEHSRTPLLVAALVGLFLLVQHRIDRDDPKLSRGHRNDPPDLRFGPVMAL